MVFKPLSHLARRSSKAFAHHAQSITAASSTTTSQHFDKYTHHRFVKPGSVRHRDGFHTSAGVHHYPPSTSTLNSSGLDHGNESGLDAYFAAWQRVQHGDEWHQFQFRKRIGWKDSGSTTEQSKAERDNIEFQERDSDRLPTLSRAYSASAVEGIKQSQDKLVEAVEAVEAAKLTQVDQSISDEVDNIQRPGKLTSRMILHEDAKDAFETQSESSARLSDDLSPQLSSNCSLSKGTASSSIDSTAVSPLVDHVILLEKKGHFTQIPEAFEAIISTGDVPPAEAYNALISAAIRLPTRSYQVIPKVLDVYSDMLRRKAQPNDETYTLLLQALALRSIEVRDMQRVLELKKIRYCGMHGYDQFMFRYHETEAEVLAEDDSFAIALKIFSMATRDDPNLALSSATYRLLIQACAASGDLESMIQVHSHMESHGVIPYGSIYPAMVEAFATAGELSNAVECYEAYKSMAIADDSGQFSVLDRVDDQVYTALVKGYLIAGRQGKAKEFYTKLSDTSVVNELQFARLTSARNAVLADAYVAQSLKSTQFNQALDFAGALSGVLRDRAYSQICETSADYGNTAVAALAHEEISDVSSSIAATSALLALYIRQGNIIAARKLWSTALTQIEHSQELIEPVTMYAIALIGSGYVDEGLMEARKIFKRVRSSEQDQQGNLEASEIIDEAIELLGRFMKERGIVPSAQATMNLMWAMVDNGGLLPSTTEQMLSGLGPKEVNSLSWQDLKLALNVEAGMIANGSFHYDEAHSARFSHLLESALLNRLPLDERTVSLVRQSLAKIGDHRPDLVLRLNANAAGVRDTDIRPVMYPQGLSQDVTSPGLSGNYDPYTSTLDQRGSSIIVEELEKQGSSTSATLSEALARFRNIRRSGRHPRYIAYAKLISAAAKDGRTHLIYDIFGMAERDIPLLLQYPILRHGWALILDAMVGACLTAGDRVQATAYHQRLREIGCAPTANTFGLYITTLKESTKTFDEASEAVKIFHQARSEGVEPSSFLYNALIGKLGKARRIDDCLFYFAEMRSRNIRPTSVTYGTIVNALCRVSDERFAQELFEEMESMPNYRPRPAPYNSLMQFFLTTKRDSSKVLEYYQRMQSKRIQPTMHTYKLLIDTYATLDPINLAAAEGVLDTIRKSGQHPEAAHYASLIHAKGCVLHDMSAAQNIFNSVLADSNFRPQACLYQALFESMVANHCVKDTEPFLLAMESKGVQVTPYIANTLIHGWALEKDLEKARSIYNSLGIENREPSTYEAMTRAFLSAQDRENATEVVQEMLSRGYPSAVSGKILEILGHNSCQPANTL